MLRHLAEHSSDNNATPLFENPVATLQLLQKELNQSCQLVEEQQREIDLACSELIRHRQVSLQLLERLNTQCATISVTGEICHCTRAFASLLESSPQRLQQECVLDYFMRSERNQFLSLCRECIKSHKDTSFDSPLTVTGRAPTKVRLTMIPLPGWKLADQVVATELLLVVTPTETAPIDTLIDSHPRAADEMTKPVRDGHDTVPAEPITQPCFPSFQQIASIDSIGWFAGGLAHEFNNVLTAVTCNISMSLMELPEGDSVIPMLKDAAEAVSQATILTQQLLEFSRRQPTSPELAKVDTLIEGLHPVMKRCVGGRYSIRTLHQTDCGVVNVDPRQFEMVLINLVKNARDAMPEGGELLIETANIVIARKYSSSRPALSPGNYIAMCVTDSGSGMSQQTIEHLFEPFCTTKTRNQNAGLGLATSYTAIRQAGGGIEVSSTLGKGTSVTVYLPRVLDFEHALLSVRVRAVSDSGPETILVVEDEPTLRSIGARILRRLGYRVLCAANGVEAFDVVAKHQGRLDLLFTDVVMPGMNGRELSARLRKIRPDMKVLYTSGYTERIFEESQHEEPSPDTRPSDYLSKPYLPETLANRIREMLHPEQA